jgi:hypothetical protein
MTESSDLGAALSSNYLLVDVQIHSWSGKKTDQEASSELLVSKQATRDGGAFVKNLLASANAELKAVQTHQGALRRFVYERTLPWSTSAGLKRGDRILATTATMQFLTDLKPYIQDTRNAVKDLQTVWQQRVAQAMCNLGTLADASDYPDASTLPELFGVSVDLKPLPAITDFGRLNVPGDLAARLGQRYEQRAQEQFKVAMGDLRDRFIAELERMHGQLAKHASGEKTRLHESMATNLQMLVDLAHSMDLGNNPQFTELVAIIEHELLRTPVGALKQDLRRAGEVADAAKTIAVKAAEEAIWQ